jgi:hypothetical protein
VKVLLTVSISLCVSLAIAQTGYEGRVPLRANPALQNAAGQTPSKIIRSQSLGFGKAPFNNLTFPFSDWFDQDTTELNASLWVYNLVKINPGAAVLNAQDSNNVTYASGDGSVGIADYLLSKNINIRSSNGQLFISFIYSTGNTWNPTDELSLEFKNQSGVFTNVWSDPKLASNHREVRFPVDLSLFASDSFAIQFVLKTSRINSNTATFLMHNVNLTDKLQIPWYESFVFTNVSKSYWASPVNWQHAQANVFDDGEIPGIKSAVFDAYTQTGKLYANNGYADTLLSQPFDLTKQRADDSTYFVFSFKKFPASSATDSLFLEFLDTGDTWMRVWSVSAPQVALTYTQASRSLNLKQYQHDHFQFRFINKCDDTVTDTLQFGVTGLHISSKIRLPFVDDFSNDQLFPSPLRWKERRVYINNDFAIAPPSVNVATFDGLDERGNPYGQGDGFLDSLTSFPINLAGLTRADSVYLSFYVEPQGLGDTPETKDSLVLEFRSNPYNDLQWQTVWGGSFNMFSTTAFTKVAVLVDSVYLHDDFQFRFKNYGSRTGNLDNWHLDYVILDKGRTKDDGYFDFALCNNPPSLLNKYSSMPIRHYQNAPSTYTNSVQQILVSNNDKTTVPMFFARSIYNPELFRLDSFSNTDPGVSGESRGMVAITSSLGGLTTSAASADSLIFTAKYYTNSNNNFDNIPTNDTLSVKTIMSNYFAYDDGTAEAGYGLFNQPGSVALGYTLELADSLYGISMFFNQSEVDVSTLPFNLMIWKAIGTNGNGTGETVIKRIAQSKPTYKDLRNGFYYLQFSEPIYMPAGKFYIGWEQTSIFNLNMGLDMNYQIQGSLAKNPDMWFKLYDVWGKTQIEGALMMRPIIGKWIDPPVGIQEFEPQTTRFEVKVYPNPASSEVHVQTQDNEHELELTLMDMTGKTILTNQNKQKSLPLTNVTNGVYFIQVRDLVTGHSTVKKLLINQ